MAQILSFPKHAYTGVASQTFSCRAVRPLTNVCRYEKPLRKTDLQAQLDHYRSCHFSDLMPQIDFHGGSLIADLPIGTVTIQEYRKAKNRFPLINKKVAEDHSQLVVEAFLPPGSPWSHTGALKITSNPETNEFDTDSFGTPVISLTKRNACDSSLLRTESRSFPCVRIAGSRIYLTSGQINTHLKILQKGKLRIIQQFFRENQPDDTIVIEDNRIYFYLHRASLHWDRQRQDQITDKTRCQMELLLQLVQ
ncbi:MAG: hypothetical protein ACI4EG_12015 [Fusicatenibacter sp.]